MKVLAEINRGGFGRVERVRLPDGTVAARKVFDPAPEVLRSADQEKLRKRFRREAKVQSALKYEFFLPILNSGLDDAEPWFLMPLADATLEEEIKSARAKSEVPTKALADVLNALEQLHAIGFVHRDLKPANVLLHGGRWKLSDFGLVLPASGTTTALTSTYSAWGTAQYCAPEQAQDFRNSTPAVDVYAFGCILHDIFVAAPRVPYQQQTASGPIGYIIEKCADPSPKRRFKNITSLRGVLLSHLSKSNAVASDPTADEWAQALESVAAWTQTTFEEFVRFLRRAEDEHLVMSSIFSSLDEDAIRALHANDASLWAAVAAAYSDYSRSSFGFAYCDVVVGRLEAIFELGDLQAKASAAVSVAILGRSHNRWFVMGRLLKMCGPSLDEVVAERIAIEIEVDEAQGDFVHCAVMISQPVSAYHARIAERLKEE
jgi:serine/threonine protein kinase